jgi:hypothetical protein
MTQVAAVRFASYDGTELEYHGEPMILGRS